MKDDITFREKYQSKGLMASLHSDRYYAKCIIIVFDGMGHAMGGLGGDLLHFQIDFHFTKC